MSWKPIATAPKTGEMLRFMNEENNKVDVAYWCDYSWFPSDCRSAWDEEMKNEEGEWSSLKGNFPMTHWDYMTEKEKERPCDSESK